MKRRELILQRRRSHPQRGRLALAVVYSRALAGLDAPLVRVEVHTGAGLPCTHIVGLNEDGCRTRERL